MTRSIIVERNAANTAWDAVIGNDATTATEYTIPAGLIDWSNLRALNPNGYYYREPPDVSSRDLFHAVSIHQYYAPYLSGTSKTKRNRFGPMYDKFVTDYGQPSLITVQSEFLRMSFAYWQFDEFHLRYRPQLTDSISPGLNAVVGFDAAVYSGINRTEPSFNLTPFYPGFFMGFGVGASSLLRPGAEDYVGPPVSGDYREFYNHHNVNFATANTTLDAWILNL